MNSNWGKIRERIYNSVQWGLENHPGKFIGFLSGFLLALAFIILGFWQTIFLGGLSYIGYYIGKCWDEGQIPSWLNKLVHIIHFKGKK